MIALSKAADELGILSRTLREWWSAGLLKGRTGEGGIFICRDSLERLNTLYPELVQETRLVERLRDRLKEERRELDEILKALAAERVARGFAPLYVRRFIDKFIRLMKVVDTDCTDTLLEDEFIRCWILGHDVHDTCKANGVSYSRYLEAVKRYRVSLRRMDEYSRLVEKNRELENSLALAKSRISMLQGAAVEFQDGGKTVGTEETLTADDKERLLSRHIHSFHFSRRTQNVLDKEGIRTLGQLVGYSEKELCGLWNFGRKSLYEINCLLHFYGLSLRRTRVVENLNNQTVIVTDKELAGVCWNEQQRSFLAASIDSFPLSRRTQNVLTAYGVTCMGQVVQQSEEELLQMRNFGMKCLREVTELLSSQGIHLAVK